MQQSHELFHIHLVSDASGELTDLLARSAIAQLEGVMVERHLWNMVRKTSDVKEVLIGVEKDPGMVLHTVLSRKTRQLLEEGCRALHVKCIAALEPFVEAFAEHFGAPIHYRPTQYLRDNDYYRRMEAMRFSLRHDDGQIAYGLDEADIILFGVSRTSKTPLCVYLANRGYKAANIPVVPGLPLPEYALKVDVPLKVGLTMDPSILADLRRQRLRKSGWQTPDPEYANTSAVAREVAEARRLYLQQGWPVVDTTMRSVEEIAASIIKIFLRRTSRRASALHQ